MKAPTITPDFYRNTTPPVLIPAGSATGGAAVPGNLGGRTRSENQPVHSPGHCFRDGGPVETTNIDKGYENG